jgi:hypothetical protein
MQGLLHLTPNVGYGTTLHQPEALAIPQMRETPMLSTDTLASVASSSLFETTEPQLVPDIVLLAPESAPTAAEGYRRSEGDAKAEIDKPENRAEGARPEPSPKQVAPENIRYYDLKRNWTKKIEPHLDDRELNEILTCDFNKFTWGRWGKKFGEKEFPHDRETCFGFFWQRGRFARYRWYTRHDACHWLVNFALRLATLSVPSQTWRIITSDVHSTVWNGRNCLFDFNWFFIGESAGDCFESAHDEELAPGEYLDVGFAARDEAYYALTARYERERAAAIGAKTAPQQLIV